MQKTNTLPDIGGRPVTVYEVRPRDVLELFHSRENLKTQAQRLLPRCVSLSADELLDLYPSESAEVWKAFQEVNSAFFDLLRAAGVVEQVREMMVMTMTDLRARYAEQYRQAITALSTTDGPSS
ncbi:MAG: hypothetical protein KUA37_02025 [Desulfomicrobium sp.]|nr:hypothetical protein [Pseudomonadota bacterium]MBV1710769.1 hypothetical protein [Desulfomicrobium sp.]MBU4570377.1 hypothetical protein [Pseudomonadota bacterium]MBU4593298.1 hypothetical protein [Pseudomonadota bacterium]MBV1721560.1 hypothetical protein [Desulfomicrobium sp.]